MAAFHQGDLAPPTSSILTRGSFSISKEIHTRRIYPVQALCEEWPLIKRLDLRLYSRPRAPKYPTSISKLKSILIGTCGNSSISEDTTRTVVATVPLGVVRGLTAI